jgi:hypothetical protein
VLAFKGRHRTVWGRGYTELFFLDEVTALAAGHRPCFECRRKEAERFATLFAGGSKRASAGAMDAVLHGERLNRRDKHIHRHPFADLPDGAMIVHDGEPFAVRGRRLLRWSPSGYDRVRRRTRAGTAAVLTPPSILAVLAAGYAPLWHGSASGPHDRADV